jgi:hypothetical protein
MSLADHFDDDTRPVFGRGFDIESARRQFRLSVMLVAAMGIAAFTLGFLSPIELRAPVKAYPAAAHANFSRHLSAIN